ncbi:MAG: DHH family phosphoesterase [bacterium]
MSNYEETDKINKIISNSKKILIIQADNPDGDSLGSALALEQIISDLGKEPILYCSVDMPTYLRYLAGWDRVSNDIPNDFDAAIIVDTSSESLLEKMTKNGKRSIIGSKPLIVLDHHTTEANIVGASVICNKKVVSTGELIYELSQELDWPLNLTAKNMIVSSTMSDSLGLTSEATTARSIAIISELVEGGVVMADLENKRRELMKKSQRILKYKGELIKRIEYYDEGRIALILIPWDEIEQYSHEYNPSMLVIDEMRMVEDVVIAIALKTYKNSRVTGKIRCNYGHAIADKVAEAFGGGGHKYASGFKIEDVADISELKAKLIEKTTKLLESIN